MINVGNDYQLVRATVLRVETVQCPVYGDYTINTCYDYQCFKKIK
jgi:hypothetical protein